MKKTTTLKKIAYVSAPSMSSGFVPSTNSIKLSVSLQGVDIKIHGFNGSSWEVLHDTDGAINFYIADVLHQKYYFESKTGSEQTIRVSFISSEEKEFTAPRFGITKETRKFHDIEEVPVYNTREQGKMLTIMSDGSLRWLGINESYIVEVIGTGGEGTGTSHVSAHLEENGTLFGNAAIVDGILVSEASGDYTRLAMTDDYRSSVNQTISFWFKSTYNPSNGNWMRFVHSHIIGQGPNGFFVEMRSPTKIYFKGATQGLLADSDPTAEAPYALNDGEWHQITVSWQDSGSEALRMWVDGQPLTVLNETHVGSGADTKPYLFIGARQFGSPMEMDKVGITEEFIDDAEALARYNSEAPASNAVPVEFFEDRMHSSTFANYASPANYLFYSSYDDTTGVLTAGRGVDRVATLNISGATEPFATNNDAANDGDLTKKVAISFWYKGTGWKTGTRIYASLFNVLNETGQTLFGMRMTKNDWYSGFFVGTPYSNDSLSGANAFTNENGFHIDNISDDNWHHIAYYYDGASTGGQKIFVDGVLAASKAHGSGAVTIDRYMSSGANSMIFNADNADDYTGGDFDSIAFYQGLEFTEAMAAEIYADSTRQGSVSQPSEAPVATPEPLLWEDKFTLGGDASLYDDGDAGNVMRTNTTGFAWSYYHDFLTSEDPDQMVVSFWFKCNDEPMNTLRRDLFGSRSGAWGVMAKLIGNGNEIQLNSTYSSGANANPPPSKSYTIDLQRNVWYNVVITLDKVAGFARTYVNGAMVSEQSVTSTAQWTLGTSSKFGFGSTKAASDNNATYEIFDFDSFQMTEGFALTDEQIASIYNDGSNREVVIASDM